MGERGRLKLKEIKIDSFEMKFEREREREILHSLEILMGSCAKIDASCSDNCLQGETIGCRKKCNEALCNEHIIKILTNNDCYTRYYRARRFVFFFTSFS